MTDGEIRQLAEGIGSGHIVRDSLHLQLARLLLGLLDEKAASNPRPNAKGKKKPRKSGVQ